MVGERRMERVGESEEWMAMHRLGLQIVAEQG